MPGYNPIESVSYRPYSPDSDTPCHNSLPAEPTQPIKIQDKNHNILRTPTADLLFELGKKISENDKKNYDITVKLAKLSDLLKSKTSQTLDKDELKQCATLLHKVSKNLSKKNKPYQLATHQLSRHIYNAWIENDISERREKILRDNKWLKQPGNKCLSTASLSINAGTGGVVGLNTSMSTSRIVDCDDDGLVESGKDVTASGGVEAGVKLSAIASATGKADVSHTRNTEALSYDSLEAYVDTLCSRHRYRSLHSRFGRNHSVKYYQNKCLNNLDPLQSEVSSKLRAAEFSCAVPHQDAVNHKQVKATTINTTLSAKVTPAAALSAEGALNYTHENRVIDVNFMNSMVNETLINRDPFYCDQLKKITPHFLHAFSHVTQSDRNMYFNEAGRQVNFMSAATIEESLDRLEQDINSYCQATRAHDRGEARAANAKHQLEKCYGVKAQGRYGFFQSSEATLALLASRLKEATENNPELEKKLQERILAIDAKITAPALRYQRHKLEQAVKFTRQLNVKLINDSVKMRFTVASSLMNGAVTPSVNIEVTVKNNKTIQANRLRAGTYRDIMFDVSGSVDLANIPNHIIQAAANAAGIPAEALSSSLAQCVGTNIDLTLGGQIMIRYFRPSWKSSFSKSENIFSHQFTRLNVNATAAAAVNTAVLPVGVKAGVTTLKSVAAHEQLGMKTLSYILIRHGYCRDTWNSGGSEIWADFLEKNRKSLTKMMFDMTVPGTTLNREVRFFLEEAGYDLDNLDEDMATLFADLSHAGVSQQSFTQGCKALLTLLDIQRDESGRIFNNGLIKENFDSRRVLTRS